MQQPKTTMANINNTPPSSCTSIPSNVRWLNIAPSVTLAPRNAPIQVVFGMRSNMVAINSVAPVANLPHGSTPICSNINMLSADPVNFKKSVRNKMAAEVIRKHQHKTFNLLFISRSLVDLSMSNNATLPN